MIDIAKQPPATRSVVSEIARRQNIPAFYLAKIVPRLARAGLVRTSLGASGGITLAIPAEEISILQVIEAVDGPFALNLCSLDPTQCEHYATCPSCETWRHVQAQLNKTLASTRIADLARKHINVS